MVGRFGALALGRLDVPTRWRFGASALWRFGAWLLGRLGAWARGRLGQGKRRGRASVGHPCNESSQFGAQMVVGGWGARATQTLERYVYTYKNNAIQDKYNA